MFEDGIERLIAYCDENREPPSAHIVRKVMKLSESELEALRGKGVRYAKAAEKLDDYRTYFWLKKALDDPKWATFATFNLKQSANGGYCDKPSGEKGEVTIRLELSGVGKEAFK